MRKEFKVVIMSILGLGFLLAYSGGSGTELAPYQIANAADLIQLSKSSSDWSKYFIQTADIDFGVDSTAFDWDGDGSATWDSGDQYGFSPIGNNSTQFRGAYDGDGYTISHLYIDRSADHIGLFGYLIYNPWMKNISLRDIIIKNCTLRCGGLAGHVYYKVNIENCSVTGKIYSNASETGGLVGYMRKECIISNCYTSVELVSTENLTGGLVGGADDSGINNSYASGRVVGTVLTGGLAGEFDEGSISNCFAQVDVSGDDYTGGFIGSNSSGALVTNCYFSGSINTTAEAPANFGVFCGRNYLASISNSFCLESNDWDAIGSGVVNGATEKSENELKDVNTYTNTATVGLTSAWDFSDNPNHDVANEDIWGISSTMNNGMPSLANMPDVVSPICLVDFSAELKNGQVVLTWETASETNNAAFLIYRNDEIIARIDGAGSSTENTVYSYCDEQVKSNVDYTYMLADVDFANQIHVYKQEAVRVKLDVISIEKTYQLGEAFPNPFNPRVAINLEMNKAGNAIVNIFNSRGELVECLKNAYLEAGNYELNWDAQAMCSGIYFIQLLVDDNIDLKKITLLK